MKTSFCILLLICFISAPLCAQEKLLGFDIEDFNRKTERAAWLYQYDAVAWWTTDSLMAEGKEALNRLGPEWFCFQSEDSVWHAIYGRYENGAYDQVFHYTVDTDYSVSRSDERVDTAILNGYARALMTANAQIQAVRDSMPLRFNQFVEQNEDGTYWVGIFPAFQPNGYAVYGGEFVYHIDASGTKVLKDESYFQGQFRAFEVKEEPREVWMNFTENEQPTLGNVFFILYYREYFTSIKIDNQNFVTFIFTHESGEFNYVHVDKREPEEKKKRRKKKRKP